VTLAVLRLEARRTLRGALVVGTFVVYALMLAYGGVQSVRLVRGLRAQIAAAEADQATRWQSLRAAASQPKTSWSDVRSASLVGGPLGFAAATLRIDRLAVLGAGESARMAPAQRVSLYATDDEPPLENPLAAAGGRFDLPFVITWLLPLTLIVVGHGAISGDRHDGVWAQVLGSGARPEGVLARRVALPASVLVGLTVIGSLGAVLASGEAAGAGEAVRLSVWLLGVALYAGLWMALTALASIWARSSAVALLALGLTWLTAVWAVPAAIDAAATLRHPVPDRWAGTVAEREMTRDLEARLPAMLDAVYADHPEWRPTDEEVAAARRPVPGGPASRDARRVYVPARVAAAENAVRRQELRTWRQAVEQTVDRASVLSPPLLMQRLADEVSGLSFARFDAFAARVAERETAWHDFFAPLIMRLRDLRPESLAGVPLPAPGGEDVPVSRCPREPLVGLTAWVAIAAAGMARSRARLRR